jgi:23S rRNA (cytidine1920-2'-O)/16S rRNA (cytidine1409-2'-O)-methyltransferase
LPSKPKTAKKRLDLLVVERGLAESREKAQAMILAGEVRVNGERRAVVA